jgi:hypothetical protein
MIGSFAAFATADCAPSFDARGDIHGYMKKRNW